MDHKAQTSVWTQDTNLLGRTIDHHIPHRASSFEVITANGDIRAVHISQIKPYQDDVLEGRAHLHFYRPGRREAPFATPEIHEILSHRVEDTGLPHFLVHWSGSSPEQDSWLFLLKLIEKNVIYGPPTVWSMGSVP